MPSDYPSSPRTRAFFIFLVISLLASIFIICLPRRPTQTTLIPGLFETIRIHSVNLGTQDDLGNEETNLAHVIKAPQESSPSSSEDDHGNPNSSDEDIIAQPIKDESSEEQVSLLSNQQVPALEASEAQETIEEGSNIDLLEKSDSQNSKETSSGDSQSQEDYKSMQGNQSASDGTNPPLEVEISGIGVGIPPPLESSNEQITPETISEQSTEEKDSKSNHTISKMRETEEQESDTVESTILKNTTRVIESKVESKNATSSEDSKSLEDAKSMKVDKNDPEIAHSSKYPSLRDIRKIDEPGAPFQLLVQVDDVDDRVKDGTFEIFCNDESGLGATVKVPVVSMPKSCKPKSGDLILFLAAVYLGKPKETPKILIFASIGEIRCKGDVMRIKHQRIAAMTESYDRQTRVKKPHRMLEYIPNPAEFNITNPTREQTKSLTPDVCVIAPWHRSGLYNDMHAYMSAFESVKLVESLGVMKKRHCILCIQLSSGQIYYDYLKYCKTTALMLNIEWADKTWYWERFDFIFAKTNHTVALLNNYWEEYHQRVPSFKAPETIYTKHTYLEQAVYNGSGNLDYNLIAHLSGESVYKSTDKVVDAWLGIEDRKGKKLVISCFGQCRGYLKMEPYKDRYHEQTYLGSKRWVFPKDDLTIYIERMPDSVYRGVLESAGYYLCPSRVEGYGMYIDDARSRGAVILSTDNYPMNELVTPENGYLVEYGKVVPSTRMFGAKKYHLKTTLSIQKVREALEIMISEDRETLVAKGRRSREMWARDSIHFYEQMHMILERARNMNLNETANIESDYQIYTAAPTKAVTTCPKPTHKKGVVCKGWKQTAGCRPSGKREPTQDKACSVCIEPNQSGYCLCDDDRRIGFSCHHEHIRCDDVCSKITTSQKVLCPTLKEVTNTPKETRHAIWDDPSCKSGCKLVGHCGDDIPCCVKPKGVPKKFWQTNLLPKIEEKVSGKEANNKPLPDNLPHDPNAPVQRKSHISGDI